MRIWPLNAAKWYQNASKFFPNKGIRDIGYQIKQDYTIPLVNDLEIKGIFKDKNREEGDSVTDLVVSVYQLLRQDLQELVNTIGEVKPQDKE